MNPALLPFLITLIALVFLILCTFSTPFSWNLYYLRSDIAGGLRLGGWGWCIQGGVCTRRVLGYSWDPQVIVWLTKMMVWYPIAAFFAFFALVSLLPTLLSKNARIFPSPIFSLLSLMAAFFSLLAFIFMIALFATARNRFRRDGYSSEFGPMPWISLVATLLLIGVSFMGGCGRMFRGNKSPYVTYPGSRREY
ncbi:pali-domain-containing protein [Ceratobasidium sp. AG-I]|nr:pali-domain-containing protein [Ceratobasidium sp. AG-I]